MENIGIHWFRRDLRVAGNKALSKNWKINNKKVIGLFCFDDIFLSRPDFSHNRFAFFLNALKELQTELREIGSDLLLVNKIPQLAFPKLISYFSNQNKYKINTVSFNLDYEPFAINRDNEILNILQTNNIDIVNFHDHLLFPPGTITKDDNSYYKVYSPFAKKWIKKYKSEDVRKDLLLQEKGLQYLDDLKDNKLKNLFSLTWKNIISDSFPYEDSLEKIININNKNVDIDIPKSGFKEAVTKISQFKEQLIAYDKNRDYPQLPATSKMSLFLKNGSISSRQIIHILGLHNQNYETNDGATRYLKELIWREFYYNLLYFEPRVEHEAFIKKYKALAWQNNTDWFLKWKMGQTGFPIIDAGMRELKTTGWMHNRVRMIVASFLTKDLLIDWRWGEKYFMETLLDGDLAPNNGGWQWAASTGCDSQPYFRIFNPWSQSKKFDNEGVYIKTYIPELKDLEPKLLHQPILNHHTYPEPIVDHKTQREIALNMYKTNL